MFIGGRPDECMALCTLTLPSVIHDLVYERNMITNAQFTKIKDSITQSMVFLQRAL